MEKIKISRAVIVEGKYDKAKLASLLDGLIIPLGGFRIYRDKEKAALIRAVAKKQGLVVLTDSDRAGFQLRGYLKSIVREADVLHVYIPQVKGKEKRKASPGAEGLLGVEGIDAEVLRGLLLRAGAIDGEASPASKRRIERMDFYEDGLSGGKGASERRGALIRQLGLPSYLSSNSLLEIVNSLMTYEEYCDFIQTLSLRETDGQPE